jgi:hypothetical protein
MKILLSILLSLISVFTYAQDYPIKTIYKNDSVVIMTYEQSIEINKTIDEQAQKISQLESIIYKDNVIKKELDYSILKKDSTISMLNYQVSLLNKTKLELIYNIDSLNTRLSNIENWMLDASISNSYIYMDWNDTTIKSIYFLHYRPKFNTWNGYFKVIPLSDRKYYYHKENKMGMYDRLTRNISRIIYGDGRRPKVGVYPYSYKINSDPWVKEE